jgi:flavodoxin
MHEVLVFYATSEGQTRRIAERLATDMRARGFDCRAIDVTTADAVTEDLLRLFGMPAREAHKICTRPLPEIDSYE